jgi:hypothetical protein
MKQVIQYTTFSVLIESATKRVMKLLTANSVLEKSTLVSIRTRRYTATKRSIQGETLANDACFDAAFLTFKAGQVEVVEKIPLAHIEAASTAHPAEGFQLNYENVDWNTSQVEVATGVTLDTGKVFEFTIGFIPK